MFTYDVTIGRNVGDQPMSDIQWDVFQRDVLDAIVTTARRHVDTDNPDIWAVESWTRGVGTWNGMTEESAHFQLRTADKLSTADVAALVFWLKVKAAEFKQDAIALSFGESTLLMPDAEADVAALVFWLKVKAAMIPF